MTQNLRWFLYSVGVNAWEYPNASELKTIFINGEREEIDGNFVPYENLLKEDCLNSFKAFLNSIEEKLLEERTVKINCIQVSNYAVTINPFTPKLKLFMRDV